jgi:hypothetical protein
MVINVYFLMGDLPNVSRPIVIDPNAPENYVTGAYEGTITIMRTTNALGTYFLVDIILLSLFYLILHWKKD